MRIVTTWRDVRRDIYEPSRDFFGSGECKPALFVLFVGPGVAALNCSARLMSHPEIGVDNTAPPPPRLDGGPNCVPTGVSAIVPPDRGRVAGVSPMRDTIGRVMAGVLATA